MRALSQVFRLRSRRHALRCGGTGFDLRAIGSRDASGGRQRLHGARPSRLPRGRRVNRDVCAGGLREAQGGRAIDTGRLSRRTKKRPSPDRSRSVTLSAKFLIHDSSVDCLAGADIGVPPGSCELSASCDLIRACTEESSAAPPSGVATANSTGCRRNRQPRRSIQRGFMF